MEVNNLGGSLGGPIIKSKTHFFYNLDMIRGRTIEFGLRVNF